MCVKVTTLSFLEQVLDILSPEEITHCPVYKRHLSEMSKLCYLMTVYVYSSRDEVYTSRIYTFPSLLTDLKNLFWLPLYCIRHDPKVGIVFVVE